MTYTIRKQDTITRNYGVFWGVTLVEGGFSTRSMAEDVADWWQENHPNGPDPEQVALISEQDAWDAYWEHDRHNYLDVDVREEGDEPLWDGLRSDER